MARRKVSSIMTKKTKQSKTTPRKAKKGTVKTSKIRKTKKTSKKRKKPIKKSKKTAPIIPLKEGYKIKYIDIKRVQDVLKLQEFLKWIAMPTVMRVPKLQKQFAKQIGVSEDTLTDWKRLEGFWNDVKPYRDEYFRASTGEVLEGLKMRARLGKSKEVKLYMQIFEGFSEKLQVEDTQPAELTDVQKKKIDERLSKWKSKVDKILNKDGS